MRLRVKSWIRWFFVVCFAAIGCYGIITEIIDLMINSEDQSAARWLILAPANTMVCGVFVAISYLIYSRHYRRLCTVIAFLIALSVFGCVITIPERFGVNYLGSFVENLVGVASLVAAWYAAVWLYRRSRGLLMNYVHNQQ